MMTAQRVLHIMLNFDGTVTLTLRVNRPWDVVDSPGDLPFCGGSPSVMGGNPGFALLTEPEGPSPIPETLQYHP